MTLSWSLRHARQLDPRARPGQPPAPWPAPRRRPAGLRSCRTAPAAARALGGRRGGPRHAGNAGIAGSVDEGLVVLSSSPADVRRADRRRAEPDDAGERDEADERKPDEPQARLVACPGTPVGRAGAAPPNAASAWLCDSSGLVWKIVGSSSLPAIGASVSGNRPTPCLVCRPMPPLISREEALRLGELTEPADIEALVERAWSVRLEHFAESTDMCSLVNAKSGGCAEDCGFCAQSRYAEAETPMHAMMEPEQILEHARAAEAAGRAPLLHGHPGPGAEQARLRQGAGGRAAGGRADQPQALRLDRPHVGRARAPLKDAGIQRVHHNVETAESYYPEVSTTVSYAGRIRTIQAVKEAGLETCVGGILNLGETREQRVEMAFELSEHRPRLRPHQPAQSPGGHEVRRPGVHGPVGGRAVDRDLPPDHPARALPPVRRARGEPPRAAAAGHQGRGQRRDDGQLPHHPGQHARAGPRDVRGPRAERRPPARQRLQPAARQPLGMARGRDARRRRRVPRRGHARREDRGPAVGPLDPASLCQEGIGPTRARTARRIGG